MTFNKNKPLPPYASILSQYQKFNVKLKIAPYIFIGQFALEETLKFIENGQIATCLLPDTDFNDYHWPVKGLRLIIYQSGKIKDLDINKFIFALFASGATQITLFNDADKESILITYNA